MNVDKNQQNLHIGREPFALDSLVQIAQPDVNLVFPCTVFERDS